MYVCMCVHMLASIHVCLCIRTVRSAYIYIYYMYKINIHMYVYICIYIAHIYIHTQYTWVLKVCLYRNVKTKDLRNGRNPS